MDLLPEELLIEIFNYLSSSDLLHLTTLNSYFNEVISSSPQILKKFSLYFRKSEEVWIGSRAYSNLIIENYSVIQHEKILQDVGGNIRSLKIKRWNWSLDIDRLLEIFRLCPNLKLLKFEKIQFNFMLKLNEENLPKYDNLELELLETDSRILPIFKNCTARTFSFDYVPSGGRFTIPEVIDFIKRQESLEELTLSGFVAFIDAGMGKIIFNDVTLSSVKFRLKKLCLKMSPLYETIHFNNFLRLHAGSLTHLEIDSMFFWDFSHFLTECTNLTNLKILKRDRQSMLTRKLETVKSLTIEGIVDKIYLANFPNLKFLNVSKLKVTRNVFDERIECDKIEELVIDKSWLGGFFKFPALKKIHFKDIRVLSPEIFQVNCQLEEIIFENCMGLSSNVIQKIDENCEMLKVFVVK